MSRMAIWETLDFDGIVSKEAFQDKNMYKEKFLYLRAAVYQFHGERSEYLCENMPLDAHGNRIEETLEKNIMEWIERIPGLKQMDNIHEPGYVEDEEEIEDLIADEYVDESDDWDYREGLIEDAYEENFNYNGDVGSDYWADLESLYRAMLYDASSEILNDRDIMESVVDTWFKDVANFDIIRYTQSISPTISIEDSWPELEELEDYDDKYDDVYGNLERANYLISDIFSMMGENVRKDKQFILTTIKKYKDAVGLNRVIYDGEYIYDKMQRNLIGLYKSIGSEIGELGNDEEFILGMIKPQQDFDTSAFDYMDSQDRRREYYKQANTSCAVDWASDELKSNPEFWKKAISINVDTMRYMPLEILNNVDSYVDFIEPVLNEYVKTYAYESLLHRGKERVLFTDEGDSQNFGFGYLPASLKSNPQFVEQFNEVLERKFKEARETHFKYWIQQLSIPQATSKTAKKIEELQAELNSPEAWEKVLTQFRDNMPKEYAIQQITEKHTAEEIAQGISPSITEINAVTTEIIDGQVQDKNIDKQ